MQQKGKSNAQRISWTFWISYPHNWTLWKEFFWQGHILRAGPEAAGIYPLADEPAL
jgi:hypothetical protein